MSYVFLGVKRRAFQQNFVFVFFQHSFSDLHRAPAHCDHGSERIRITYIPGIWYAGACATKTQHQVPRGETRDGAYYFRYYSASWQPVSSSTRRRLSVVRVKNLRRHERWGGGVLIESALTKKKNFCVFCAANEAFVETFCNNMIHSALPASHVRIFHVLVLCRQACTPKHAKCLLFCSWLTAYASATTHLPSYRQKPTCARIRHVMRGRTRIDNNQNLWWTQKLYKCKSPCLHVYLLYVRYLVLLRVLVLITVNIIICPAWQIVYTWYLVYSQTCYYGGP